MGGIYHGSLQSEAEQRLGPDGVANLMIIHAPQELKEKILNFFNAAGKSGKIPEIWKQAEVIPILKDGMSKVETPSYRPVALTSCLGQLMEHTVKHDWKNFPYKGNVASVQAEAPQRPLFGWRTRSKVASPTRKRCWLCSWI